MTSENSRVTTKILVLLLIGQRCTTNQKHFEGLSQSSDRLLVRNFCARFSDVYNQWWRHKIPAVSLIFSPPLQNFMFFLQQKMSPLFFLSRSSSFSHWALLACRPSFSFSLSFSSPSIFQIFGHDN